MIARRSWCSCGQPADGHHHGRPLCLRCLAEEVDPSQAETWADRWPALHLAALLGLMAVVLAFGAVVCVWLDTLTRGG
ncbi:MAG: hypothetical protein WC789_09405 [Lentisphaeria bacterium]